jgi:hypothetical protein
MSSTTPPTAFCSLASPRLRFRPLPGPEKPEQNGIGTEFFPFHLEAPKTDMVDGPRLSNSFFLLNLP